MHEESVHLDATDHEVFTLRDYQHNLTGTYLVSDKPITVITGTYITLGLLQYRYGRTSEALPSVTRLGKVHILPPFGGRAETTGYFAHVVAAYDNTLVTLPPGGTSEVVNRGEEKFIFMNSPYPTTVICSQRCLVMMYSKSTSADDVLPSGHFMTLVPSVSQTINSGWFNTDGSDK